MNTLYFSGIITSINYKCKLCTTLQNRKGDKLIYSMTDDATDDSKFILCDGGVLFVLLTKHI